MLLDMEALQRGKLRCLKPTPSPPGSSHSDGPARLKPFGRAAGMADMEAYRTSSLPNCVIQAGHR